MVCLYRIDECRIEKGGGGVREGKRGKGGNEGEGREKEEEDGEEKRGWNLVIWESIWREAECCSLTDTAPPHGL
ncbi:MAG: hypothetical protein Q9217_002262 [Psora testacea]